MFVAETLDVCDLFAFCDGKLHIPRLGTRIGGERRRHAGPRCQVVRKLQMTSSFGVSERLDVVDDH